MTRNFTDVFYDAISYHAILRTQERTGLNQKLSEAFIINALKRGKTSEDFTANERSFLEAKEAKGDCGIVVYQSFLFVIDAAGVCVTMYAAPKWFGKKKYFDGKVKIKNIKKYSRFNEVFDVNAA